MILVGIDVAKDKHDCCIINSDGKFPEEVFSILNNREGYETLYKRICSLAVDFTKVKVGLESTGHYSSNLLAFLLDKHLTAYVINPLRVNLFRKGQSLRRTKTDKIDSRNIAHLLMADSSLKPYSLSSYHMEELKSLTRYRGTKVRERTKLKTSIARLVTILFPELEQLVSSIHIHSIYAMLEKFPGSAYIAAAHLTRLTALLLKASRGRFGRETAIRIRDTARQSIGAVSPAKSMELQHTIAHLRVYDQEIGEIESEIEKIMDDVNSPITSMPGIGMQMGAVILAEIGSFRRFDSPDKILAYAGMSPSMYQSGKLTGSYSRMEKRGSRYLRYALFNVTRYVCHYDPGFTAYLSKKRKEGKHYYVAISHAVKRLVRVLYAMEISGNRYKTA